VFNASTSPMKEGYAVSESNIVKLAQPGICTDSLTEILLQRRACVADPGR